MPTYVTQTYTLPDTFRLDPNIGWNAGAVSVNFLDGDAAYHFKVVGTPSGVVTGISTPESNGGYGYREIQYAFFISNSGYRIMEGGVAKTAPVAVSPSAIYSIIRLKGQVIYRVNDTTVYTSLLAGTAPFMLVDSSLYAGGDAIENASISEVESISTNISTSHVLGAVPTITRPSTAAIDTSATLRVVTRVGSTVYTDAAIVAAYDLNATTNVTRQNTAAIATSATVASESLYLVGQGTSAASFEALKVLGSNKPVATSAAQFSPLTTDANGGLIVPQVSSSAASLAGVISNGYVLTGEVASGDPNASTLPLDSVGADSNYGESATSLFGLTVRGGEIEPVDGFLAAETNFRISLNAIGSEAELSGLTGDVPAITVSAFSGSGAQLTVPKITISATADNPPVGRVKANVPTLSVLSSGKSGITSAVTATYYPSLSVVSYGGGSVRAAVPKITTAVATASGGVASLVAAAPKVTSIGNITVGVYGRVEATVPSISSLYGAVYAEVPFFSLGSSIFIAPTGYTGYSTNVTTNALSRYPNYHFDHMFRFNGEYYGVLDNTIYSLRGQTDNGLSVDSVAQLAPSDLGETELKRLTYAYIGGRADQTVQVEPVADEVIIGDYTSPALDRKGTHTRRVRLPRGARARYWGVRISNVAGDALDIESVEYKTETLSRKT